MVPDMRGSLSCPPPAGCARPATGTAPHEGGDNRSWRALPAASGRVGTGAVTDACACATFGRSTVPAAPHQGQAPMAPARAARRCAGARHGGRASRCALAREHSRLAWWTGPPGARVAPSGCLRHRPTRRRRPRCRRDWVRCARRRSRGWGYQGARAGGAPSDEKPRKYPRKNAQARRSRRDAAR
jgi:hypothetical protein